ncbi:peptidoglycan DD-metalloendopeptidase family protein [Novosphingobium panipatense]
MKLATQADGRLDSRFARMGRSLARMSALENGLTLVPQVSPAHVAYVSSSFGYRSDPFTGGAAFHAGLDFPGPMGSPIYAAAKGRVTFAGQKHGYGNCIEVTHGNGLMTRYGHLSGFRTRVGQEVEAGALIGAMGSTGRSTGPHLHFEVRVNDRPVNPRPFLEAARLQGVPTGVRGRHTNMAKAFISARSTPVGSSFSMLGADVTVNGDITASADLHVDGNVQGDLSCNALIQGEGSEIHGAIRAQSVRIGAGSRLCLRPRCGHPQDRADRG